MTTAQRTDIHRPSLLDPAEYSYLGCFYQGASDEMARSYMLDMRELEREIERRETIAFDGNYTAKLTCDHCGASFNHGAVFQHIPTNTYITVGHICANDTIGLPSKAAAARRNAEKAARAAAERAALIASRAAWREENGDILAFLADEDEREKSGGRPVHYFLRDMISAVARYGGLTEGQANATRKFMERAAEFAARDAERAAAPEPTTPLVEGRRIVEGEIVSTKWQDSLYGGALKMLVVEDDLNKVWGTVPRILDDEELKGARVRFQAQVERSRDDEHFGFFKRPTKAEVVTRS